MSNKVVKEERPSLVVGPAVFWYYVCTICGNEFTDKAGQKDEEVVCYHCKKGTRNV
jgi:hypothetical protein